jgi:hypothetical protein
MNLKSATLRAANALLAPAGFRIQRLTQDFDARLDSPRLVERIVREFSRIAGEFFAYQSLFEVVPFDIHGAISSFYKGYIDSPFRERFGGSRFNNLVWLFLIAKAYQPTVIVDSGTYQGASAWALRHGAPKAALYSFDIDLSGVLLRVEAHYIEADWTTHHFSADLSRGLCYFDDHIDQAKRLLEAAAAGFPLAIFDDDFPVTSFAEMAYDGALPKIEFVLDDELRNETELSWVSNGVRKVWTVDRAYLDRARAVIAQTERLPNTSLITGIHQTPYRVVRLVKAALG